MLHIVLLKEFYSVVISYYVYCTLQSKRKFTPMGILLLSPLKSTYLHSNCKSSGLDLSEFFLW